jgi:hypothetical protein
MCAATSSVANVLLAGRQRLYVECVVAGRMVNVRLKLCFGGAGGKCV